MKLTRRNFLRIGAVIPFLHAIPAIAKQPVDKIIYEDDFLYNHTKKTIEYVGVANDNKIHILDFYEKVKKHFENEMELTSPIQIQIISSNLVKLENGWKITDDTAEHLYNGSLIQEDGIFFNIAAISPNVKDGDEYDVTIMQNGKILEHKKIKANIPYKPLGIATLNIMHKSNASLYKDNTVNIRIINVGKEVVITETHLYLGVILIPI